MPEDDEPGTPPPRANNITLLGWTAFFSGMGQEMVYPLVPTFVVLALHSSRKQCLQPALRAIPLLWRQFLCSIGP